MEHKDKEAPSESESDPATATQLASWTLGPHDSDGGCFFSGDGESTILNEFGWNLDPNLNPPNRIGGAQDGGGGGFWLPATSNNQTVSSSSSEDPPEKSAGSNEKPSEIP